MAIFGYANRGELPDDTDAAVMMAFSFIQSAMDDNSEKYRQKQAARSEAGRAGGLAKASKSSKASVCQNSSSKPSLNESVSVSVSVSESLPPNGGVSARAKTTRFTPPTLAEVSSYVAERLSPVDPQEFIDFYEAKGWMVGKTPMKDWKAACRNAEKWDRWAKCGKDAKPSGGRNALPSLQVDPEKARADLDRLDKLLEGMGDGH